MAAEVIPQRAAGWISPPSARPTAFLRRPSLSERARSWRLPLTACAAETPAGRHTALLATALLVLLLTSFPWVAGTDEAQSADSAVINGLKLLLVLAAAAAAVWVGPARPLPLGHLLLAGYGLVTAVGALLAGDDPAAVVRSARLVLLVFVIGQLAGHLMQQQILRAIAAAAVAVAGTTLLANASGLAAPAPDGRLTGFLPPMHPNILASLCMVGLVSLVGLWLHHDLATRWLLAIPLLVAVLVGTGSRTSLVTSGLGIAIVLVAAVLRGRRRAAGLALWLFAAAGLVLVGASSSSLRATMEALLTRGGTATIDPTLTGRTYVWADAAAYNTTPLERAVGQGLGVKALPRWVGDTYELQGIDSTWYSAWVAGGLLGLLAVAAAMVAWLGAAVRRSSIAFALVVAIAVASPTESVLADISFGLVVLLAVTASALPGGRPRHAAPLSTSTGPLPNPPGRSTRWVSPPVAGPSRWLSRTRKQPGTWVRVHRARW